MQTLEQKNEIARWASEEVRFVHRKEALEAEVGAAIAHGTNIVEEDFGRYKSAAWRLIQVQRDRQLPRFPQSKRRLMEWKPPVRAVGLASTRTRTYAPSRGTGSENPSRGVRPYRSDLVGN